MCDQSDVQGATVFCKGHVPHLLNDAAADSLAPLAPAAKGKGLLASCGACCQPLAGAANDKRPGHAAQINRRGNRAEREGAGDRVRRSRLHSCKRGAENTQNRYKRSIEQDHSPKQKILAMTSIPKATSMRPMSSAAAATLTHGFGQQDGGRMAQGQRADIRQHRDFYQSVAAITHRSGQPPFFTADGQNDGFR
ncbi:MAG: hypothetical protein BWY83_03103 [bacterium ADurb.Bin478]|nr:MAG: hypothetical protein BWY83_03103 [bacterium ADurb.Bin478]